jgi:hypothetical protein
LSGHFPRPATHSGKYAFWQDLHGGNAGRDATTLDRDPRILPDIYTWPYLHLEPEPVVIGSRRPVGGGGCPGPPCRAE